MKFDEENLVIISTLSRMEARAFILFLKSEISRHKMDIDNAIKLINVVAEKFNLDRMFDK